MGGGCGAGASGGRGGGGLRPALVCPQEDLVLGGGVAAASLVLPQELLEACRGEGEGLPAQLHQVGVLQPGVGEAVLSAGPRPEG